jgi:flagellar basal-body rod protein FlgB
MKPIYVFDVAARHNTWLSERQGLVAENVANASTTGFKVRDLKPFTETLDETQLALAQTNGAHFSIGADAVAEAEIDEASAKDATHSGNTVSLEREFGKAGEIGRAFSLNVGIMKALNRMILMSAKG